MVAASIVAAVIGLIATRVAVNRVARERPLSSPTLYWALGLVALLPAWLISFVGLLRAARSETRVPLEGWFILSSALALVGVIVSDSVVRRLSASGAPPRPERYWLLGLGALLPACLIGLIRLASRS
jgi:hypothetical protein